MNDVRITTGSGDSVTVAAAAVEKLKSTLRGTLLLPGDEGFDKSRTVWNAMIDRRPALVARCAGAGRHPFGRSLCA